MTTAVPDDVVVGTVLRAHGVVGDIVVFDDTDNPERFRPGATFRTTDPDVPRLTVTGVRPSAKAGVIVSAAEIRDRTAAERLSGVQLLIDQADRRPLEPGEYWPDQLQGLDVLMDATVVGAVTDVVFGPQIRLLITLSDGGQAEVPFVEALVPEVDIDGGFLRVATVEGLLSPR